MSRWQRDPHNKAESGCQGSPGDTQRRITLMGSEPYLTNPTAGKKKRGQERGQGGEIVNDGGFLVSLSGPQTNRGGWRNGFWDREKRDLNP